MAKRRQELMNRPVLAKHFDVSPMTITRWEADGMPVAKKGKRGTASMFDPEACEQWLQAKEAERAADDDLSVEVETAKLKRKQREKLELDIAERLGQLVPREDVITAGRQFVGTAAAKLRSLAKRAMQQGIIQSDQVLSLDALIREILTELSQWRVVSERAPSTAKTKKKAPKAAPS